jgi:hypothetical protein
MKRFDIPNKTEGLKNMRKNQYKIILVSIVGIAAFAGSPLFADDCATWTVAQGHLKANWGKKYPGEKIQSVTANGAASSYEKMESTGKEKIDSNGDRYEYLEKVIYCRVPAKVAVTRANGTKTVFSVSAIYKVKGKTYQFDNIGVSGNEEVAAEGQEAPSKDIIKKAIADEWIAKHPDHKVEKVAVTDPELKKVPSENRWWYNVGADIFIINEEGVKQKCVNDYTSIYKGELGSEGQNTASPYKADFFENPTCNDQ